jgi:sugar phosphate isomerase/epimerase
MDDVRATADRESSDMFTPDALRAQQVEITRRLELVGHAGRVLTFPHSESAGTSPSLGRAPRRTTARSAAVWIAGAAAAGLFVGVGAGVFYGTRVHGPAAATAILQAVERPAPAQVRLDAPHPLDDDAMFMSALEAALDRPRTQELLALDALTPHVREVSYRIR